MYEQLDIFDVPAPKKGTGTGTINAEMARDPDLRFVGPLDGTCPVYHPVEPFFCSRTQGHSGRHMYLSPFPMGRTYAFVMWDRGPYEEER